LKHAHLQSSVTGFDASEAINGRDAMMAVIVVPLGRLNSASTAACLDLGVLR
jgi:hypothetical protein